MTMLRKTNSIHRHYDSVVFSEYYTFMGILYYEHCSSSVTKLKTTDRGKTDCQISDLVLLTLCNISKRLTVNTKKKKKSLNILLFQ